MRLSEFEALSFDCYGTLIDWEAGILAVLRPWADRSGIGASDEELLASFAAHESHEETASPGSLYPEILRRTMVQVGGEFGVAVSREDAARLGASVPGWPAFPDSPAALTDLAHRFQLIILSNVDRASFRGSNERLGVAFDAIVTAEDVGAYKPAARNFEALLATTRAMGIGPGRLLHVAQSLFHDHVPAKAAGLPTVWIDRRHGRAGSGATPRPEVSVEPDWVFGSMAEFAAACAAEVEPRR